MGHQNRTRMDIVMVILYLRGDPTDASFICGFMMLLSIMNFICICEMHTVRPHILAHCGVVTCVLCVIFRAITCTVTEVASGIVNACNNSMTHMRLWSWMVHNIRTKQAEGKCSLHPYNFPAGSHKTVPFACR
jgi:hypothetical protein